MANIVDPQVALLARLSQSLKGEYLQDISEWEGSPFGWVKSRPSRQRGKIGEQIVSAWLRERGFRVEGSPDQEADRIVNGRRVEIKFSTRWKGGHYVFQQLRDQNYEIVVCLGLSPVDAHCWVIRKQTIMAKWGADDGIHTQHGGRRGSDTAWLSVDPTDPPAWLRQHGGSLSVALEVLEELLQG